MEQKLTYAHLVPGIWKDLEIPKGKTVIISSMKLQLLSKGVLKALGHRIIPTRKSKERFSAVCFVHPAHAPDLRPDIERMQVLHKKDLGFNYRMSHEEFAKLYQ